MMSTMRRWTGLAAVAVALTLFGSVGLVSAAPGTPAAAAKNTAMGHPVHLHSGTCAKLGVVVYPLTNLTAPAMKPSTKAATPNAAVKEKEVVADSTTKVKASLKDLEKKPYAINAHESAAKITTYVACGDVTGAITNGTLTVALKQQNKSGLEGNAVLTDNGDGTTTVVIQLSQTAKG